MLARPRVVKNQGLKQPWEETFLEFFNEIGVVSKAAQQAGVSTDDVRKRCKNSESFKRKYDEALERSRGGLEVAAWQRSKMYSDSLLMFLLKAELPRKYNMNTAEVDVTKLTDDEIEALIEGETGSGT